jgi:hypothetical protein
LQIHGAEDLRVPVVEVARDPQPLLVDREGIHLAFELAPLLTEIPDQVADDGEIHRTHDVERDPGGLPDCHQAEPETDARPRHLHGFAEPTLQAGAQDREGEEGVGEAALALGDEGERPAKVTSVAVVSRGVDRRR